MKALLADENFPLSAIRELVAAGYDVKSVALECPGIDDREVLDLACRTGRCLLTFDADFGDLVFSKRMLPPKAIIYFRVHQIFLNELIRVALHALSETPEGYFAVITSENIRLRKLPQSH
jgi:predicted nuclease of predicted toxin-antitoxin system